MNALRSVERLALLVLGSLCAILLTACQRSSNPAGAAAGAPADEFIELMNRGKNYLDRGEAQKSLELYQRAVALVPTDPDAHLNIANAWLLLDQSERAAAAADEVLKLDHNSAAAHFVRGSALLRLGQPLEASKALQTVRQLDPTEPAVSFQLGLAQLQLQQYEDAIASFQEVLLVVPNHPAANYQISLAYQRSGQDAEAQQALEAHQKIATENAGKSLGPATFEKSKFTQARVPFRLEQPARAGLAVTFTDQTASAFGADAAKYRGPIAILDPNHTGWNSLFVLEPEQGFRLLWNSNAVFQALDEPYPATPGATYRKMLVGDLQNDRYEDVVVLGDKGAHLFKFATNGLAMDVGPFSRLQTLDAADGALVDLDFTGKLDLVAIGGATNDLRIFRQFGPMLFTDITSTSGIPRLTNAAQVLIDDWPKDEMMDILLARRGEAPLLLAKQRGGPLLATNQNWPAGSVMASGDLNNDLRIDLAVALADRIRLVFNGTEESRELAAPGASVRQLRLVDYDNDGWLDLLAIGDGLRLWRNVGQAGFEETTRAAGLDALGASAFATAEPADFDLDGDTDLVLTRVAGGLAYLRNDGGHANDQLKIRLLGNRSNASGLGVKVDVTVGGLRLSRTVQSLPVEIGVGKNQKVESVLVHWFNLAVPYIDVPVDRTNALAIIEITLPEGSCPYLYAWDGEKFRFITDVLGAAPAGLPVAEGRIIESDPDEFVLIGRDSEFVPRQGEYVLQLTEELREILCLDEAKLAVVDYRPGTEVHPLDKLVPGKPFPPSALTTLQNERPLRRALNLSGQDVTEALRAVDGRRVSPERLRQPQQRGLAEPHGLILDFGELDVAKPLALVLNGWLRFGGGMANVNASHDPSLPFPFPTLEAETSPDRWQKVDVIVGAPAGKTKTIVAELSGKLPPGTRRLRLQAAFEIHWDRIALMETVPNADTRLTLLASSRTDLHWRGFSEFEDLSWDWPLTPDYVKVRPNPFWRITPAGWCTRYGEVGELIARRDEGFLIMNGGDELTLTFAAAELPPKPPGHERSFFLYLDGWDKDSDFHVVTGATVEPLPWHGMDDQQYGRIPRPKFPSDHLHQKYNTRWVGEKTLARPAR